MNAIVKPMPAFDLLPTKSGKRSMTYAGIGSRETPTEVLAQMRLLAQRLAAAGYTLRSGGAAGADQAFEAGAGDIKDIFYAKDANERTRAIARELHPAPHLLSAFPLNLMARNTYQVFGRDLTSPADFVVAWTKDGAETAEERTRATGGTGQAIEMAARKGVPVVNMRRPGWEARIEDILGAAPSARVPAPAVAPYATTVYAPWRSRRP